MKLKGLSGKGNMNTYYG
ncbi:hypothetical protein [Spirosoma litoris]